MKMQVTMGHPILIFIYSSALLLFGCAIWNAMGDDALGRNQDSNSWGRTDGDSRRADGSALALDHLVLGSGPQYEEHRV